MSIPALIIVKAIIPAKRNDSMFDIGCTAKPFDTIIKIGIYFNKIQFSSTTYGSKCQAIDLIIGFQLASTMTDGDIFQDA